MKLSINTAKTLENFGHVFSDSSKVIGELIQNARRADATLVSIDEVVMPDGQTAIVIKDNGHGIQDFDALFSLSDSGWSEDVQVTQQPFGMGFFSTLYVSSQVIIQSLGSMITVDCAKALKLEDMGNIESMDEVLTGTVITLVGFNATSLENKIRFYANCSSIAIMFNGVAMESKQSFCSLSAKYPVIESPFGKFVIRNFFYNNFEVVVQDVFVTKCHHSNVSNVLFANSAVVKVRMPDRDQIINESEVLLAARKWLAEYYKDTLALIRTAMANDVSYLDMFWQSVCDFDIDSTCDIDYLPSAAFRSTSSPTATSDYEPSCSAEEPNVYRYDNTLITRNAIFLDSCQGVHPVIATFAHQVGIISPFVTLPDDHWVHFRYVDFEAESFQVTLVNPKQFDFSNLDIIYNGKAIAVDDIIITHIASGQSVTSLNTDGSLVTNFSGFSNNTPDEGIFDDNEKIDFVDELGNKIDLNAITMVLVKRANHFEDVLCQVERYNSEYDVLQDELTRDADSISNQIIVACNDNFDSVLADMMGAMPIELSRRLEGKTGTVSFAHGKAFFSVSA